MTSLTMHFIRVQKKALDADAKKVEQFKAYNILPLESAGVNSPFQSFPEVR